MRLLFLFLLAFASYGGVSYSPTTGSGCSSHPCTITVTGTAGVGTVSEIQTAVNAAECGDTIKFEAGTTWTSTASPGVWIQRDPGCATGSRIILTTTEDSKLPNSTTRITPAYWSLLPKFQVGTGTTGMFFAVASAFEGNGSRTPGTAGKHWEFRGLGFYADLDINDATDFTSGFIRIGSGGDTVAAAQGGITSVTVASNVATVTTGSAHGLLTGDKVRFAGFVTTTGLNGVKTITSAPTTTTYTFATSGIANGTYTENRIYYSYPADSSQLPDDIVIDRCIFSQGGMTKIRRDIYVNAITVTIKNSWVSAGRSVGQDSQHILGLSGAGPYLLENNYISGAATENIMFGGSPAHLGTPINDVTVRYSYLGHIPREAKRERWQTLKNAGDPIMRGRIVRPTTDTGYRYVATNTVPGLLGASEPNFAACTTTSCTVTDGGVTWKRGPSTGTALWVIKNNFELKSAQNVLLDRNVFEYMWPPDQSRTLNIKAEQQSLYPTFLNNCVPSMSGTANVDATGLIVTANTGEFPWIANPASSTITSITPSTDYIKLSAAFSGLQDNLTVVFFGDVLPGGVSANTVYFTRGKIVGNTTDFKISTSQSDAGIVDITSAGTNVIVRFPEANGELIKLGSTYHRVATFDSATQLTLVDAATPGTGVAFDYGADPQYRSCQAATTQNVSFISNIVRNGATPLTLNPGTHSKYANTGGFLMRNNLIYGTDPTVWKTEDGAVYHSITASFSFLPIVVNAVIENNTVLSTNSQYGIYPDNSVATSEWPGDTVIRNNIFSQPTTAAVRSSHSALQQYFCGNGGSCPTSQWNKNIFTGVSLSTYTSSTGTTYNLCGNTNSNTTCGGAVDLSLAMKDATRGDYRVNGTVGGSPSIFKRTSTDGRDFGADMSQLPRINDLKVDYSDRAALFTFSVTAPISHIPCVVEVSERIDFGTYAGELGSISTYYRKDADDADMFPRKALSRTLVVGHTVSLNAATKHWYRLSCGGDVQEGSFTTEAAKTSTATVSVTKSGASSMTWGYTYSRATGAISGGGTVACSLGVCSATPTKGRVIYYKVDSGRVRSMVVH